jgi:hypothetical protein
MQYGVKLVSFRGYSEVVNESYTGSYRACAQELTQEYVGL